MKSQCCFTVCGPPTTWPGLTPRACQQRLVPRSSKSQVARIVLTGGLLCKGVLAVAEATVS